MRGAGAGMRPAGFPRADSLSCPALLVWICCSCSLCMCRRGQVIRRGRRRHQQVIEGGVAHGTCGSGDLWTVSITAQACGYPPGPGP
jgi:hypothetical protein